MESLDTQIANWIDKKIIPLTPGNLEPQGVIINNCIPGIFESYCKLFHPFEINITEADILISDQENRQKNGEGDLFQQYQKKLKEFKPGDLKVVTWKNIASKFGLIFHDEINTRAFSEKFKKIGWPKNISFPKEGRLPRILLIELLAILKKENAGNVVFIYQSPPNSIMKIDKYHDLVRCTFEEVLKYFEDDFIGYLYPEDKSWIVYTGTDLHFTIIGGKKKLIDAIVNSHLEAVECESTTRVDNDSDKLNRVIL